jgi:hypothetical protein
MKCLIVGTGDMAHALALQYTNVTPEMRFVPKCVSVRLHLVTSFHSAPPRLMHFVSNEMKASRTQDRKCRSSICPRLCFHDLAPFVDLKGGLQTADFIILAIPGRSMVDCREVWRYHEEQDCELTFSVVRANPSPRLVFPAAMLALRLQQSCYSRGASRPEVWRAGIDWQGMEACSLRCYIPPSGLYDHLLYPLLREVAFWDGSDWLPEWNPESIHSQCSCWMLCPLCHAWHLYSMVKAWKSDSMYVLHPNLIWAPNIRKHVGLIGMFFLFVHAIMSPVDFSPKKYY